MEIFNGDKGDETNHPDLHHQHISLSPLLTCLLKFLFRWQNRMGRGFVLSPMASSVYIRPFRLMSRGHGDIMERWGQIHRGLVTARQGNLLLGVLGPLAN